jgi:hypothetical protein
MAPKDLTKTYSESFNTLSDAEKQRIRKDLLGLSSDLSKVKFKNNADSVFVEKINKAFLDDKVGEQDAFRGLAADLLKTTVNKLNEQKKKEAQFDMLKGLSGFGEIANMGSSISNSILGELGGAAGMAGVDAGSLLGGKENLSEQITNMAGLGFLQGAQYDWQKWFDGELTKRYENMKEVQGIDEAKATYKLEKEFMDSFVKDYIKPRFDYSRSIDEFLSYVDVKQDEENILQTETTLGQYKDLISKQTKKFYQDLQGRKVGFDSNFYANPLSAYKLKDDGTTYKGISQSKQAEYEAQKARFDQDWENAKKDPDRKRKVLGGNKSWKDVAIQYGFDINDKEQFAKLHYNTVGAKKEFDGAKDLISKSDIQDFINENIMPSVAETNLKLGNKPFMDFVSPESYADQLLGDYNVGTEEYQKALKDLGIDTKDLDPDAVRDQLISGLRATDADTIRESIKYYNENKKKPTQKLLGVSYIQREEDYDKDAIKKSASPLYKMFAQNGYEGTEDEFFNEFMPDADRGDMDMITSALEGGGTGTMFDNLDTSDPFSALSSIGGMMGDGAQTMFGDEIKQPSSKGKGSTYFDVFGDKEKEYDDYTNKYSGIQDLGTFGSFNYFK